MSDVTLHHWLSNHNPSTTHSCLRSTSPTIDCSTSPAMHTLFHGTFIHCTPDRSIEILQNSTMMVEDGIIQWLHPSCDLDLKDIAVLHGVNIHLLGLNIVRLACDEFMVPGLVDTHNVSLRRRFVPKVYLTRSIQRPFGPWACNVRTSLPRGGTSCWH